MGHWFFLVVFCLFVFCNRDFSFIGFCLQQGKSQYAAIFDSLIAVAEIQILCCRRVNFYLLDQSDGAKVLQKA